MSEEVIRHRGGGRDENGQLIPPSDDPLEAFAVAPGGSSEYVDRARDGETIAFGVYFRPGVDVVDSDELTVRGKRCTVVVNDWRSPRGTSVGGLEVLCTRGQG